MTFTFRRLLGSFGLVAVLAVSALAGGKNLQHYPKDISEADLKAEMRVLKRSLGTSCDHCHQSKPARDFTVDTDKKKFARQMLDMTKKIDEKLFSNPDLFDEGRVTATCYMCHKGEEKVSLKPEKPEQEKRFNDSVARGKKKRIVDAMKKLVDDLNRDYFTWKDAPKATCWMCHRGRGEFRTRLPKPKPGEETDDDEPQTEKKPDPEKTPATPEKKAEPEKKPSDKNEPF